MSAAGVSTVRLFPEWPGFEARKGQMNWSDGDRLLKSASEHRLEINAILMGSAPGTKAGHTFPMEHLDDWRGYVSSVVGRYGNQVRYWEVWNEGKGGFNDGRHTTSDYAQLAIATYESAKQAHPRAKVGLTVASYDAPYLHQTIRAMRAQGKPNSFDFLCIHPYEIADGLVDRDGEIPFLWMTRSLRSMLKEAAPERANAEIWMTEIGHRLASSKDHAVTEQDAAKSLAKMYVMAIAQGIACSQWFEAQDPIGEDQGFGLIARNGQPRAAFHTLKTLVSVLGDQPKYEGWLPIGQTGQGYGFVFQGRKDPVLVGWMPQGCRDDEAQRSYRFSGDIEVFDALSTTSAKLPAGQSLVVGETPVFVLGVPAKLVQGAQANASQPFPWGGNYANAKAVSFRAGHDDQIRGVFPRGRANYPTVTFADGSSGLVLPGDIGHPILFYTHPSFASFQTDEYYVRVAVRRLGNGNVGMNLRYEVADSQGRSPYANVGKWFGANNDSKWQTYTWHVTKACFSKMWGHDLVIAPEQSVPFVLGQVEVSTVPFE